MGEKKNRNAPFPNAEGVRRGAVGSGMGECCKLPQRAELGRQTTFGAFLVWKCFICMVRPSGAIVNAYLQKILSSDFGRRAFSYSSPVT